MIVLVLAGEWRRDRGADDDDPARQALADIVVGVAEHLQRDALAQERAQGLPRRTAQPDGDVPVRQLRHAKRPRDLARQPGTDRAVGVADRIGQLHLLAAAEHCGGVLDDLRVQAVGHFVAEGGQREAALAVVGVHLGEDRVQVEIVEMLRPAADLAEQFGAADHLVQAAEAEPSEDVADFFGDERHQVDDLFRGADEFRAQTLVLRADADRAGVRMTLPDHDAAHRDEAQRARSRIPPRRGLRQSRCRARSSDRRRRATGYGRAGR